MQLTQSSGEQLPKEIVIQHQPHLSTSESSLSDDQGIEHVHYHHNWYDVILLQFPSYYNAVYVASYPRLLCGRQSRAWCIAIAQ